MIFFIILDHICYFICDHIRHHHLSIQFLLLFIYKSNENCWQYWIYKNNRYQFNKNCFRKRISFITASFHSVKWRKLQFKGASNGGVYVTNTQNSPTEGSLPTLKCNKFFRWSYFQTPCYAPPKKYPDDNNTSDMQIIIFIFMISHLKQYHWYIS